MAVVFTEQDWKKYTAEAIGTFFLTMGGMLAMIGSGPLIVVAAAHGTVLGMMIYAFGGFSGGHFNPAVSTAIFIQRKLSQRDYLMYLIFQTVGATVGALVAVSVTAGFMFAAHGDTWSEVAQAGATLGQLTAYSTTPLFNPGAALLLEILLTFTLATTVSVVVAGGDRMSHLSGALIGGTLFAAILWGGPWTGASLNPARSIGPALVSGTNPVVWASLWVYILGPILGGALAAFGFMWFRGELRIHFAIGGPGQASLPPQPGAPTLPAPQTPPLPPPTMGQPPGR